MSVFEPKQTLAEHLPSNSKHIDPRTFWIVIAAWLILNFEPVTLARDNCV